MPRSKKGKKSGKKSKGVSKEVKAYVDRKVEGDGEVYIGESQKLDVHTMNSYSTTGPTVPTIVELTSSLSGIAQGDGQGNRSGNQISLKKLMFRGIISGETIPLVGKFIIAKLKQSLATPVVADFSELIQDGNTAVAPNNSLLQIYSPLNRDYWDVKKTFMFKITEGASSSSIIPKNGYGMYHQFSIDLGKYLPKTIRYNDASADPTNCRLYGFVMLADPSGGSVTMNSVQLDASLTPYYHDK